MHQIRIVAVALLMVMLTACGSSAESQDAGGSAAEGAAAEEQAASAQDAGAGEEAQAEADTSADGAAPILNLAAAPGDRIVREGTMRLEVEENGFDRAFNRVVDAAARLGGTVLSSDATSDDEGLTSGSVTVRVPADDYDALLTAVADIGTVRERSIRSEDVSAEFVDLEARLRHNEAQERFYLSLLGRAEDVEDAIAVQQRVDDIQQTIEQIKGRLSFLEERTSFSRLTVELFEAGSAFQQSPAAQPTFAYYWETAGNALVRVLGMGLVVATVLLPFVLVGLVIFVVVRVLGPIGRRRRPEPAAPPAPET
jgi:large-conductance mechanosensitive channel